MKLLGIISVSFDVTDQLLISIIEYVKDLRKNGSTMRQYVSYSQSLHNILIESGVPMKLVRLIKMCLNETYSKVCIGKHLSDDFPIQNGLKQGSFIAIAFQLCFRICP
jgi:hypothetical protein